MSLPVLFAVFICLLALVLLSVLGATFLIAGSQLLSRGLDLLVNPTDSRR